MSKKPQLPQKQQPQQANPNDFDVEMRNYAIKLVLSRYRKKQVIFDAQFIQEMFPRALQNYLIAGRVNEHIKVNPFEIARATDVVQYICEFHLMNINGLDAARIALTEKSPEYREALARDVGKALFFIEHIVDGEGKGIDKSNPLIVFPSVLYNYLLGVLANLEARNVFLGNRRATLCSLYQYTLLQLQSIMSLLSINIKDAVCLWRNLHETECIATVLYKNDEAVADEFLYFQKFAFVDEFDSDKPEVIELNDLYYEFKKNHREMKATRDEFREKGWLRGAIGFNAEHGFNVKRGLQPMAGLEDRYQAYRTASKIVHPSGITFNLSVHGTMLFAYEQILLTTVNILTQIRGLAAEDRPDIFDQETGTLLKIINAYFGLFKRGVER